MASADDAPVSDAEAAILFAPLRDRSGIALAVSGGPDSSALLVLYARARPLDARLPPAVVFTVDHRLRPEAAAEARLVAALAARHGLPHRTLVWDGDKPKADLQAAARRARYALMVAAAEDLGLDTLATAHHAEDQAETFLARLARGSGVVGLAAMARERRLDGLLHLRPFLDLPRARLRATLRAHGETWIDDPSNTDRRFDRVRLREAAPLLAELGLDRDRLTATARAMARAAAALDDAVDRVIAAAVDLHPAGWASLSPEALADLPEDLRLRLFARLLATVGGADYGPRLEPLERLVTDLAGRPATAIVPARTLAGVRIEQRRGRLWFAPEPGRTGGATLDLALGSHGRRLGRRFDLAADAPGPVTIAPLGAEGRRFLNAENALGPATLGDPAPSAAIVETAPAARHAGTLVACPGLGWAASPAWAETLRAGPPRLR